MREMCSGLKYIIYLGLCCVFTKLRADEHLMQYKKCTELNECPDNSICTKVNSHFSCVCWQGYHQNPEWKLQDVFEGDEADYCTREKANKTVTVYNRVPAKKEHLAIAILLVLFGVIVVTLILYCLVVMRPIKRTQAVYRRMQLRRNNHRRLEEFDDIDMTFRDTHSVDEVS